MGLVEELPPLPWVQRVGLGSGFCLLQEGDWEQAWGVIWLPLSAEGAFHVMNHAASHTRWSQGPLAPRLFIAAQTLSCKCS